VRAAGIVQWSGTAGAIQVSADGTGPVRLRIAYTRRDGESGAARTVRRETRTLRGSTAYTSGVTHDPGRVACGKRAYFGILVMTEPAAVNGPQVSEVAVDGPACPAPVPSRSTETTDEPTDPARPTDTGTPTQGQSTSAFGTPAPSGSKSPSEPLAQPSTEPSAEPLIQPGEPSLAGQPSVR
jgi:serine/threonine-protein kinase